MPAPRRSFNGPMSLDAIRSRPARQLADHFGGVPLMRTTPFANALRAAAVILAVLTATVLTATSSASAQTPDKGDRLLPGRTIPLAERAIQPPALPMWDTAAAKRNSTRGSRTSRSGRSGRRPGAIDASPAGPRSARARRPKPDPPLWLFRPATAWPTIQMSQPPLSVAGGMERGRGRVASDSEPHGECRL